MKLLNVFALVVGVHLAVLTIIFATPGCRSTGKQKPKPEDTKIASSQNESISGVEQVPLKPELIDTDLNPGSPGAPLTGVSPIEASESRPNGILASGEAEVRFAPTRPSSVKEIPTAQPAAAKATHVVAKGDNLWSLAKKYGISVAELSAANQLAPSATLRVGQQLTVPEKKSSGDSSPKPTQNAENTYEVKSGDTLGAIARKSGTTVAALRTANNLKGDSLRIGQKLIIPGNALPVANAADAVTAIPANPSPKASASSHTVIPGDTLGGIARKHGVKVGDLATLNTITDPAKLRVGQVLRLPVGAKAASSPVENVNTATTSSEPVAPKVEAKTPGTPPIESTPAVEALPVPVIRID